MRRKLAVTRAAARQVIAEGRVRVGGVPEPKPATLVAPDTALAVDEARERFVGRGGVKLEAALRRFPVSVGGRTALDVGASTGGFTDCLLQHGAAAVVAVDVGYGQLAWRLRADPRVTVVERTNFRHADPADWGAPFGVVVADLSFISLALVAAPLAAAGDATTDYVVLVKPQFEVGKGKVGSGGVVRRPDLRLEALQTAAAGLAAAGLGLVGVMRSPVTGASGNVEFLAHLRQGPSTVGPRELEEVAAP